MRYVRGDLRAQQPRQVWLAGLHTWLAFRLLDAWEACGSIFHPQARSLLHRAQSED